MPDSVGIKTPDFGAQLQGSSKKKKNEYGPTYEQRVIDMKRQPRTYSHQHSCGA